MRLRLRPSFLRAPRAHVLLLACVTGGLASALTPSPARADLAAQARFHERQGRDHYERGRYREALREFFALRRIAPLPRTTFNIALCFDQLGEEEQAFFFFSEYLKADPEDAYTRRFARSALERLTPGVARLRVETTPPGASVFVDRREHGSWGRTPITIPLKPGRHRVWVDKPGFRAEPASVEIAGGASGELRIPLSAVLGRARVEADGARVTLRTPEGATLEAGPAPLDVAVAPGTYVAEVVAPGFRSQQVLLTIEEGRTSTRAVALEALPAPTGQLVVSANVPGALIEVDGEPMGFTPSQLPDVPLGLRRVRVSADGRTSWESEVTVVGRRTGYLSVQLEPPARRRRSPWTWVSGGVGLASLGTAVALGVAALDANQQYDAALGSGSLELDGIRARGDAYAAASDALYVTGGVALGVATLLYFLTEEETAPTAGTYALEAQVDDGGARR